MIPPTILTRRGSPDVSATISRSAPVQRPSTAMRAVVRQRIAPLASTAMRMSARSQVSMLSVPDGRGSDIGDCGLRGFH